MDLILPPAGGWNNINTLDYRSGLVGYPRIDFRGDYYCWDGIGFVRKLHAPVATDPDNLSLFDFTLDTYPSNILYMDYNTHSVYLSKFKF
jgi:hypothetical protein